MRLPQSALTAQVCLFLVFVSSTLAGSMTLIGSVWPSLPIPHGLTVSVQGALALLFGGMLMMSLMLSIRWLQIFMGGILCLMSAYQIVHSLLAGPNDSSLSWLTGLPRLEYGPSICILILGFIGLLGFEHRYGRVYARIVGCIEVLVGVIVWSAYLWKTGSESSQLVYGFSRVLSLFSMAYGVLLLILPGIATSNPVRIGRVDAIVGALGVVGTFVLLVIASWGTHLQRQNSANLFLQSQEIMLKGQLQESVELIERLADRWSALNFLIPPELVQTELRRYFKDLPALKSLIAFDNQGQLLVIAGKTPQQSAWARKQLTAPEITQWVDQVESNGQSFAWLMPDASQPMSVLLLVIPENPLKGLFFVSYDLGVMFAPLFELTQHEYSIQVEALSEVRPPAFNAGDLNHEIYERMTVHVPNGPEISLVASAGPVSLLSWQGALIPAILGFGLLVSFLLMLTSNLATVQRMRARELKIEEQRFRSLFYQSPEAVFEFSKDGCYLSLNQKAMEITGISLDDLGEMTFKDLLTTERMSYADFMRFERAFCDTLQGTPQTVSVSFGHVDGDKYDYECSFAPILVDGAVVGVYAVVSDVTERFRAQEHQRLLTRSLETSDSAVLVIDIRKPTQPAVFVNSAFSDMSGYLQQDALSYPFATIMASMVSADEIAQILRVIENAETASLTVRSRHRDGSLFWNQMSLAPVRDENGCVTHYTAIMKDVSEAREQESKLAYQATYDALTGLPNRAYFDERLERELARCKRENALLAVLFIDLDEFKPINDALGHRVGDDVLISIANSVSEVLGPDDTLARFGGDEFVLLLPSITSIEEAGKMAQNVLKRIGQVHRVGENELYVTASVGISYLNSPLQTSAKLLQQADIAMYKAKQQGRDTFVVYADDLEAKLSSRVQLRNDLQDAIKNNHLFLHYQPQVDSTGKPCGIEALVRWNHPVKGLISPGLFIPIAEETGQIIHLGHWVLMQACRDARELLDRGVLPGRMAVNLSPLQFHRPGFVGSLQEILNQTDLPAQCLELELTEGILMRNSDAAIALLKVLGSMEISTSIDDFGTGFSSFSYLKNLPVERVKIDRVFVENVTTSQKDAAVCQGIITMAGQMGITVIAEGVETEDQFKKLKQFGCDVFQGFRFARPMSLDDLEQWLQRDQGPDTTSAGSASAS